MTKAKQTKRKPKVSTDSRTTSSHLLASGCTEESQESGEAQLKVLLDKMPMGVYLIDADFRIQAVNPIAKPVFGKIPDLIGHDFTEVIHGLWSKKYADEIVRLFRHTLETGEPYYTPERIEERRDLGVTEYYEWWVNRIPLADGRDGVVCYFRDVSTQVFARIALLQSEEKFRTLFNSSNQGFSIVEVVQDSAGTVIDFRYQEVNYAYEQQTGISKVVGKLISEVMPRMESYWMEQVDHVVRTGEPTYLENYNVDTRRWYQANYTRIGGAGSRLVGIVFDEITERKRREANLAFIAEVSEDLAAMTNSDETLQMLCEIIGMHFSASAIGFSEVDEAAGTVTVLQTWSSGEVIIPSDVFRIKDYHSKKVQKQMRSGKPEIVRDIAIFPKATADNMAALKIGAYVNMPLVRQAKWCLTLSIIDSKSRDWHKDELALMSDLTTRIWTRLERARAEEELSESQNQLRLALDAAEMGTFIWYPEEDRTEQDARMLTLLGLREGDTMTLAKALAKTIHPDDREAYASAVARALDSSNDGKLDVDWRAVYPDGSIHWLHIYGQVSFADESRQHATVMYGMVFDITESKQAENEQRNQYETEKRLELLTEQRNALVKINKTKDDFIALASHQLRTPATAVKQYIRLLLDDFFGPIPAAQAEYLQIAYDSNERQLTVINDLLKTAQLDSSTFKLDSKSHNIVAVAQEAVADLQTIVKIRNQTVVFESSHKTIPIMADPIEMKLVLVNLLENASKYSYPGAEISVSIVKKATSMLISITDTGVGINKDNQKRIFDKFTRVDNDLSDTVTGNGLGLYWVKQITEKHKGTITLASELKKGSTFTVKLPL